MSEEREKAGVLSLKEQYEMMDKWLAYRVKHVMPELLKECGINLWIVICGEYNEDPVFRTITPAKMFTASRTSCFMFSLGNDGKYEALSFCGPSADLLKIYTQAWNFREETQMEAVHRVIREHAGERIAVNVSSINGQCDGLTKRMYEQLSQDTDVQFVEDSGIAVRWLETRTEDELEEYPAIYRIAMEIQKEAYTRRVITPGVTKTSDVEWFILQRINDLGLSAWFSPDVDLQRKGSADTRMTDAVIEEGDLIHTDMGITYLGLNTDSQRLGYILKEGETEVPEGLLNGFGRGNRFQDIVRENMISGRSGNEIFLASMEQGAKENLRPMLYTHPIGYYGHGSGPLFGLYTSQKPVPVRGELRLHDHTCYALELNVTEYVPEWEQDVVFYIEETIGYKEGKAYFMDPAGREKITLI